MVPGCVGKCPPPRSCTPTGRSVHSAAPRNRDSRSAPPLPATEALIGYLYYVALRYGPIARLGYSFWAEGIYQHIQAPFMKISQDLGLTSKNVTFFGAHAQADEEHI